MFGKVEKFLLNNQEKFPNINNNTKFNLMKIKSRPGKYSSVLFYLFINDEKSPQFLLKVNRTPYYFGAIEEEYNKLKHIYEKTKAFNLNIPKPVFCEKYEKNIIFCETFMQGSSQLKILNNNRGIDWENINDYLTLSFKWLIKFQLAAKTGAILLNDDWIGREVVKPIEAFVEKNKNADEESKNLLIQLPELIARHKGCFLPEVVCHGDFDQWNILIDGNTVKVVDWEECALKSLPYNDLYSLLFHLALLYDSKSSERENFINFFNHDSQGYKTARNIIKEFSDAHNLPENLFFIMAPLYAINCISKKYPEYRDPKSMPLNSLESLRFISELVKREIENDKN